MTQHKKAFDFLAIELKNHCWYKLKGNFRAWKCIRRVFCFVFLLGPLRFAKSRAAGSDVPAIGNLQSIAGGRRVRFRLPRVANLGPFNARPPPAPRQIFIGADFLRWWINVMNLISPPKWKTIIANSPGVQSIFFRAARRTLSIICVRFLAKKKSALRVCAPRHFLFRQLPPCAPRDSCKNHHSIVPIFSSNAHLSKKAALFNQKLQQWLGVKLIYFMGSRVKI